MTSRLLNVDSEILIVDSEILIVVIANNRFLLTKVDFSFQNRLLP